MQISVRKTPTVGFPTRRRAGLVFEEKPRILTIVEGVADPAKSEITPAQYMTIKNDPYLAVAHASADEEIVGAAAGQVALLEAQLHQAQLELARCAEEFDLFRRHAGEQAEAASREIARLTGEHAQALSEVGKLAPDVVVPQPTMLQPPAPPKAKPGDKTQVLPPKGEGTK